MTREEFFEERRRIVESMGSLYSYPPGFWVWPGEDVKPAEAPPDAPPTTEPQE